MHAQKAMGAGLAVQILSLGVILFLVVLGRPVSDLIAGIFGVSMVFTILSGFFIRKRMK